MKVFDFDFRSQNLAHGQVVIVTARWLLVAAGLVLALVNARSLGELRFQLLFVLALAIFNFALHVQLLRKRPAIDLVAYGASAADIAVITSLVILQGGFASELYVFYFPAILAYSIAFAWEVAGAYTTALVLIYAVVGVATVPDSRVQDLVARCVVLAAVAACGCVYGQIEHERRRALAAAGTRG